MDMVCEKEPGCTIDFDKDGLELEVTGDYISAKGTTLGGDDGIAVAYALAILASDTIEHPKLEVIVTVSEEVGMEGATGIDVSMIEGRKLLNIDSEEEGYMLAGCAGGCSAECILPLEWEDKKGTEVDITISGLIGGHSGIEIDKGRANANVLMGRILMEAERVADISIESCTGGSKDNAIPRETKARILVDTAKTADLVKAIEEIETAISKEFSTSDSDIVITVDAKEETTAKVLVKETTEKVVLLVNQLPNGIQRMSADIKGLVETSLNLGVLALTEEKLSLHYSVRSSIKSSKEFILHKLTDLTEHLGGKIVLTGDYPAWEYNKDSKMRQEMSSIYRAMYGKESNHRSCSCRSRMRNFSWKVRRLRLHFTWTRYDRNSYNRRKIKYFFHKTCLGVYTRSYKN